MPHSRNTSNNSKSNISITKYQLGTRCKVGNQLGIVRFYGQTKFSTGYWVGIELFEGKGKNNGTVQNETYFTCKENHGIFARPSQVSVILDGEQTDLEKQEKTPVTVSKVEKEENSINISYLDGKEYIIEENTTSLIKNKEKTKEELERKCSQLEIKLKIIDKKREEDREKLKRYNSQSKEQELFMQIKEELNIKINKIKTELKKYKEQNKLLRLEKIEIENKLNEQVDGIELLVLDKEMAEERVDQLLHEMNSLKEEINEKTSQIEQDKEENNQDKAESERIKEKEGQILRLKEALIKLRDTTDINEKKLNKRINELNQKNIIITKENMAIKELKKEVEEKEIIIEELKSRIEDIEDYDKIVDNLTEKNIELGLKINEQEAIIEDYEALKDISDEVELAQLENIKQLNEELDTKDKTIKEIKKKVEIQLKLNSDNSNTINQYRTLTNSLQIDINNIKNKYEAKVSESISLNSRTEEMLKLNDQLKSKVNNFYSQDVEVKTLKNEIHKAQTKLQIMQAYIPSNCLDSELKIIDTYVCMESILFKIDSLAQTIHQITLNNTREVTDTYYQERINFLVINQIKVLIINSKPYIASLMTEENHHTNFMKNRLEIDNDVHMLEKNLDELLQRIKINKLDSLHYLEFFDRIYSKLKHKKDQLIIHSEKTDYIFCSHNISSISLEMEFVLNVIECLHSLMQSHHDDSFSSMLREVGSQVKDLLRLSKNPSNEFNKYSFEHAKIFFTASYNLNSKATGLYHAFSKIATDLCLYIKELIISEDELSLKKLDIIFSSMYNSVKDNDYFLNFKDLIEGLTQKMASIPEETDPIRIEDSAKIWQERAADMFKLMETNSESETKLIQLNNQYIKLNQQSAVKEERLQESMIKVEYLETKLKSYTEQLNQLSEIKDQMYEYEKNIKQNNERILHLESENKEISKLNMQLKTLHKKTPSIQNKEIAQPQRINYDFETKTLSILVEQLRRDNMRLKSLEWHKELVINKRQITNNNHYNIMFELNEVIMETNKLKKKIEDVKISRKLVDVSKLIENPRSKLNEIKKFNSKFVVTRICQDKSFGLLDKIKRIKNELETTY